MIEQHIVKITKELSLQPRQVAAVAVLLEEGGTVPFIARYRKERTGELDEVQITSIRDRLEQLAELDKRRESILSSLEERKLLTEELKAKIGASETLSTLEDIYLPFRPKKRTKATVAKERGLEPLADILWLQEAATDPEKEAAAFVDAEKEVPDAAAALAGARDILAERISDDAEARAKLREDLGPDARLPFDHIGIIEWRQEMRAGLGTKRLRGGQRLVEIVARQADRHLIAAKNPRLVDLLLRRCHRHEDGAAHPEMPAGKGHALRMVARAGADEILLVGLRRTHLAHRVEGAAQFVAAHRREVFTLEPDLRAISGREVIVALQGRLGKERPQGGGRLTGVGLKIGHDGAA